MHGSMLICWGVRSKAEGDQAYFLQRPVDAISKAISTARASPRTFLGSQVTVQAHGC